MPTVHLRVKGQVQGVFFRATTKEVALKYGITGWVKNTRDGEVEITATGDSAPLEAFIGWCRQGPPRASVTDVVITPLPDQVFEAFGIQR